MYNLKLFLKKILLNANLVKVPPGADRQCPICGYKGRFTPFGGYYIRPDARCGSCGSLERHRLLYLLITRHAVLPRNSRILHFAPEGAVGRHLRSIASVYTTADLFAADVDHNWNIEAIEAPDNQFDVIVCSHVLEHVDADKALRECARLLSPGGVALLMVPICEGLDRTYENPAITAGKDRWVHFQQADHMRVFGRDFRDRVVAAGFTLTEFVAEGDMAAEYGLVLGERIFIARI